MGEIRGGDFIVQPVYGLHGQSGVVTEFKEVCHTIAAAYGAGGGNIPVTVQPVAFNFAPGKGELKDDIHITTANVSKTIDASGSNPAMHQGGTGVVQSVSACDVADTLTVGANQTTGFIGDVVTHPIVLMDQGGSVMNVLEDGTVGTLRRETHGHEPVVMAFPWQSALDPIGKPSDISGTLIKNQTMAVGYEIMDTNIQPMAFTSKGNGDCFESAIHPTLSTGGGQAGQGYPAVRQGMAVRRLTPVECERLQGFPDNHTNIPWRKKPESPDGPRYKALGNSMAVPVMQWIGKRIQMVEDL